MLVYHKTIHNQMPPNLLYVKPALLRQILPTSILLLMFQTSVQPNQEPDWPLPNPLTSKPRRECETESVDFVQKEELTQDDVIIA